MTTAMPPETRPSGDPESPSRARVGWWWIAIAAYYPAVCLAHLQFSLWLVRRRSVTLGGQDYGFAFSDAVPWLSGAAVAALAWQLARQARRCPRPWPVVAYWFLWGASAVLVDRFLTYSVNEYAHYPQYGLLAWMLAHALDPGRRRWPVARVIAWTTLAGMADELLQYLWITRSYSHYLDFNDFLVNLLAAAAGTMAYYGFAPSPPAAPPRPKPTRLEWAVCAVVAAAVGTGLASGRLVGDPGADEVSLRQPIHQSPDGRWRLALQDGPGYWGSWQPGKRRAQFHVLRPEMGLSLMLLAGGLFSMYPGLPRRLERGGTGSAGRWGSGTHG